MDLYIVVDAEDGYPVEHPATGSQLMDAYQAAECADAQDRPVLVHLADAATLAELS